MPTCPSCGCIFPLSKRQRVDLVHPGAYAPDAEIRTYYHTTAPREDLLFLLQFASPALAGWIAERVAAGPTAKDAATAREQHRVDRAPHLQQNDDAAFWAYVRAQTDSWRGPACGAE